MLWELIYDESLKTGSKSFASSLLFKTSTGFINYPLDWQLFHGKQNFLYLIIKNFGKYDINAVIELVSGPGALVLLPDALVLIKQIIEEIGIQKLEDIYYFERLVQRAYFLHRKAIQENASFLQAYLYLLDILVEAGSSASFYLREVAMSRAV